MASYISIVTVERASNNPPSATPPNIPNIQEVTVPAGATFCLLLIGGYGTPANWLDAANFDLAGQAFTVVADTDGQTAQEQLWVCRLNNPRTGMFKGTWTWDGANNEGLTFHFLFASNVDLANPIRSSTTTQQNTTISGLSAEPLDLTVFFSSGFGTSPAHGSGTNRLNDYTFNSNVTEVSTGDGLPAAVSIARHWR